MLKTEKLSLFATSFPRTSDRPIVRPSERVAGTGQNILTQGFGKNVLHIRFYKGHSMDFETYLTKTIFKLF